MWIKGTRLGSNVCGDRTFHLKCILAELGFATVHTVVNNSSYPSKCINISSNNQTNHVNLPNYKYLSIKFHYWVYQYFISLVTNLYSNNNNLFEIWNQSIYATFYRHIKYSQ